VWVTRGVFALLIGVAGLVWTMNQVSTIQAEGAVGFYLERQTEGLLNPGESSAAGHGMMFTRGIRLGIENPLGTGLGSTTKAAGKYGVQGGSTEVDLSNIFVSTGIVGGLAYLVVIALVFVTAFRLWTHDRSMLTLILLGFVVITCTSWLHGGRYFMAPFIWTIIGGLDGMWSRESSKPHSHGYSVAAST
jgi:hypothetical protein